MTIKKDAPNKIYGKLKGQYRQKSVKKRIEALFLDNIGKVFTREQIIKAATDPKSGRQPENWHQRLSELRTDDGYTILSWEEPGRPEGPGVFDASHTKTQQCRQACPSDGHHMACRPKKSKLLM